MNDLAQLSLVAAAQAIRRKKVSSVELTRACLEQAKHVQPKLNCFIAIDEAEALKAARRADRLLARGGRVGPLHGVPLAHKDMYYRAGKVSTCGSKILKDRPAPTTATALERIDAANAARELIGFNDEPSRFTAILTAPPAPSGTRK